MSDKQLSGGSIDSRMYASYSLLSAIFLGFASAYLFFWKVPGISVVIFYVLTLVVVLLPLAVIGRKELMQRVGWNLLPLLVSVLLSFAFLYRMAPGALTLGVLFLPMVYSLLYVAAFNPEMLRRLGFLKSMMLPFVMILAWFADVVGFARNIKLGGIKSERTKSVVKRVAVGSIVALPFLLLFLILFSAADTVFFGYLKDLLEAVFGNIFKGFETFMSFVFKVVCAFLVAVYFAIFNFSLYNEDSSLRKFVRDTQNLGLNQKRNWDGLTATIFLSLINTLFFLFVVVQFYYLFAGEKNIIGSEANFTYAEYARRGFAELLMVAMVVFAIGYVLNMKVNAVSRLQKIAFSANTVLLILFTFVISFSAQMRLALVESTYGFTTVRVTGHYIYVIVDLLLIALLVGLLVKDKVRFVGMTTILLLLGSIGFYFITPLDYVVAKANFMRYEDSGEIDLPYMTSLSDEAIPVLIKVYNSDVTTDISKIVLRAHLETRYEKIEDHRKLWQEYNILNAYNKSQLELLLDEESEYADEAEESLKDFLDQYAQYLEDGRFVEAHELFWSSDTAGMRSEEFEDITVISYEYTYIPSFPEWDILGENAQQSILSTSNFDYWTGMYISAKLTYRYIDDNGLSNTACRRDSLRVKLENGEWKIMYAETFNLGNFEDAGRAKYYYENESLDHLKDSSDRYYYNDCY